LDVQQALTGAALSGNRPQRIPDSSGTQPPPAGQIRKLAHGYQGTVSLVEGPDGPLIVKEAMGRWPWRGLRRGMVRREHAVYARLQGIPGVPRCYGLDDGDRLLLEYVEGCSLRLADFSPAERERFFASLLQLIQAIHAAGVAHADLKRKDNILVQANGEPMLIDFGSAVIDGPGLVRGILFRQACHLDLNAWVKLKYRRDYQQLKPADRAYYHPTWLERAARLVRETWRTLTARRWRKSRRVR
jgi:serine/threonine protein kinase